MTCAICGNMKNEMDSQRTVCIFLKRHYPIDHFNFAMESNKAKNIKQRIERIGKIIKTNNDENIKRIKKAMEKKQEIQNNRFLDRRRKAEKMDELSTVINESYQTTHENNDHLYCCQGKLIKKLLKLQRHELTYILLLGKYKNPDCVFSALPLEIIRIITDIVLAYPQIYPQ